MRLAGLAGLACTGGRGPMALGGDDRVYLDGLGGLGTMNRANPGASTPADVRQVHGMIARQNNELYTLRRKVAELTQQLATATAPTA